jgi:hypothetical protein
LRGTEKVLRALKKVLRAVQVCFAGITDPRAKETHGIDLSFFSAEGAKTAIFIAEGPKSPKFVAAE